MSDWFKKRGTFYKRNKENPDQVYLSNARRIHFDENRQNECFLSIGNLLKLHKKVFYKLKYGLTCCRIDCMLFNGMRYEASYCE